MKVNGALLKGTLITIDSSLYARISSVAARKLWD